MRSIIHIFELLYLCTPLPILCNDVISFEDLNDKENIKNHYLIEHIAMHLGAS